MINKFIGGILAFFFLISGAYATLNVTFNADIQPGQISFYWSGDASRPNNDGRTVNADPAAELSAINGFQAKPTVAAPPTKRYSFYSGPDSPAANPTLIRVWNTTGHNPDDTYTAIHSFTNSLRSVDSVAFPISYSYVRARPLQAIISQYDETASTVLYPAPSSDREVSFMHLQPASGGYLVEVNQSEWELTLNGGAPTTRTISRTNPLELSVSGGDSLDPGDSYSIRVRHQNYWSEWGPWSTPVVYTVGAGGAGGAMVINCDLQVAGGLGINQFTVPAATAIVFDGPSVSGRRITTMEDLITALADEGITVGTAGWWSESAQVMVGWTDASGAPVSVNGAPARPADYTFPTDATVDPDRVYQMSVSAPIEFTLTITR